MYQRKRFCKALMVLLCAVLVLVGSGALQSAEAAGSWVKVGNTVATGSSIGNVNVVSENGVVYVAYTSKNITYVKKLSGSKWISVGSPIRGEYQSIVFSNKVLFLNFEHTVYKYSNGKWNTLHSTGLPEFSYDGWSLAAHNGVPYLAYSKDLGFVGDREYLAIMVSKYDGEKWVSIKNQAAFMHEIGSDTGLLSLIVPGGMPYLAFDNEVVFKHNGNQWVQIGQSWYGTGAVPQLSKSTDSLYVACFDNPSYYHSTGNPTISVSKYSGGKWRKQGNSFKVTNSNYDLETYGSLVYLTYGYKGSLFVKKLKGGVWSPVGKALAVKEAYHVVSLTISGAIPYVAYLDKHNNLIISKYR